MLNKLNIPNIIAINLTALFFGSALLTCLWKIDSNLVWVNLLLCVLGGLIGWVLGNIASPIDTDEKQTFTELGRIVATFFSGYLVSKLDRFLEIALFTENGINGTSWISAVFFSSALILTSVTVFFNRTYALKPFKKNEHSSEDSEDGTPY